FSAGVARSTNSITVDQNFSPTWTGAHIFDNITRSTTTQATTTSLAVLGLTASNCDVKSTTGGTLFCGTDAGAGAAPLPNSKWATSTIPNSNGIYVNGGAGTDVLIGGVATTSTQKLEVIGGAYFSGNVGIGTTTPYAKLSVVGEIVGAYFTGTTTATSTFGGPIQASSLVSLLSSTSGLTFGGTSTPSILTLDTINSRVQVGLGAGSASPSLLVLDTKNTSGDPAGINGAMYYNSNMGIFRCFANSQWGTCGSQATTTKVMLSDCSPKITSTDFAPGGSWWQPLDMANDLIGMGGWAFQEATSSEVTCIAHIPKNISASPNAQLWSAWTSTSTSALSNVLDIDIASINPATGSVDPAAFTNIMASTSAAKRLTVAAAAWGSVSTSTSIGLTLPNTNDLVVRFRRYGANANDSSNSDLYLWSQWLEVKVDSQ
ncbi:MAG: hypothetical protein JWN89_259, partial [Parcubacteria group bacterium]|nr:hypothetical protein [Parcubacteria group bacterium]